MLKYVILIITVILSAQKADAQVIYPDDPIMYRNGDFYINNQKYSTGAIRDLLELNQSTYKLIESSRTKKKWGYIVLTGGIIFTPIAIANIYINSYNNKRIDSETLLIATVALTFDLFSFSLLSKSKKDVVKAVRIYNDDIEKRKKSSGYQLDLEITPLRVGLCLRY